MQASLKPGVAASERIRVERDRCITFMGEAMQVYSTPSMVSDVEYACLRLIQRHLDEDESSVGTRVQVDHLAPTPMGCEVTIDITVSAVEGRKVTMDACVHDALDLVGRGVHVRHVVDVARQARRVEEKKIRILGKA